MIDLVPLPDDLRGLRSLGEEIGEESERDDVLRWLRKVKPADLGLCPDSLPPAVLFAVCLAIERGEHKAR